MFKQLYTMPLLAIGACLLLSGCGAGSTSVESVPREPKSDVMTPQSIVQGRLSAASKSAIGAVVHTDKVKRVLQLESVLVDIEKSVNDSTPNVDAVRWHLVQSHRYLDGFREVYLTADTAGSESYSVTTRSDTMLDLAEAELVTAIQLGRL